jgi:catechol 2,3-dioxygenase-like lactoylglutathione lyase family enzyme
MKRFHVHLVVKSLEESIGFYSSLFGEEPAKRKSDYAKWMLDNPRLNFAISTGGGRSGVDHFGLQVDSLDELDALRKHMNLSELNVLHEGATTCCYAVSDKTWTQDPNGVAWETYHTMDDAELFKVSPESRPTACCAPHEEAEERGVNAGCC